MNRKQEQIVALAKAIVAADKTAKAARAKAHRDYLRARSSSRAATAARDKVAELAASLAASLASMTEE